MEAIAALLDARNMVSKGTFQETLTYGEQDTGGKEVASPLPRWASPWTGDLFKQEY